MACAQLGCTTHRACAPCLVQYGGGIFSYLSKDVALSEHSTITDCSAGSLVGPSPSTIEESFAPRACVGPIHAVCTAYIGMKFNQTAHSPRVCPTPRARSMAVNLTARVPHASCAQYGV